MSMILISESIRSFKNPVKPSAVDQSY